MNFTAFDFPVVVFEGMMSSKDSKAGGSIPGLLGENDERITFATSLESSLEGMFSKRKGNLGEEIAGNSKADGMTLNESDPGNADMMLSLLIESVRTAVPPDEIQFEHMPGGTAASSPGKRIGEILSEILNSADSKPPFAMDRFFAGNPSVNDTLQALVEKFGQGAARPLTAEDGGTQDRLRHLIASLSKAVENSDSQMRHVGSASMDKPDLRQAEMTGNLRMNMQNKPPNGTNDARIGIPPEETRDSLKESMAPASEKADEQLRGFLSSLAREVNPPNQAQRDSRGRFGSKMSGFKGSEANLEKEQSILKSIASVGPGSVSPLGKGGAASLGEFNLQSGLPDGTGERSGEKPVASPLDIPRPGASFDKSLQQPVENKIVGQVFMRLFSGARQGSGNVTINIYPPEMGSVKIRIISDHGRLTVHMHPGNQQVAGILEKNLGVLQQSLADQGLDVSDLFVSVDAGAQERSDFEQQALMHPTGKKGGRAGGKESHEDQDPLPPAPHDPWLMEGHTLSLRV